MATSLTPYPIAAIDFRLVPKLDPRLKPLVVVVRTLIRETGWTQKGLDAALGWWSGQTSQLFNGHADFKLSQLYDLLDAMGVEPQTFFLRVGGQSTTPGIERQLAEHAAAIRKLEAALAARPSNGSGDA